MLFKYGKRIVCVSYGRVLYLFKFSFVYFGGVLNKTIIPLAIVGYEMIISNSALHGSLAMHHLKSISNAIARNNCYIPLRKNAWIFLKPDRRQR